MVTAARLCMEAIKSCHLETQRLYCVTLIMPASFDVASPLFTNATTLMVLLLMGEWEEGRDAIRSGEGRTLTFLRNWKTSNR